MSILQKLKNSLHRMFAPVDAQGSYFDDLEFTELELKDFEKFLVACALDGHHCSKKQTVDAAAPFILGYRFGERRATALAAKATSSEPTC